MADNVAITPGTGATVAADDIAGVMHQRVKLSVGADGSATDAVGGAGAVGAGVLRATLASDDPAVTSLAVLDDWDESDRAKVNLIAGQAGITAGAGAVAASTPRVTLASDDPAVALLTSIDSDTSRLTSSAGPTAPGGALSTTSLMVGARYNATPPTFTDGQEGGLQVTANGRLLTNDTAGNALLTTIDADTSVLAGAVAGTEMQVDVVGALPAGTNSIGAVTNTHLTNALIGDYETVAASQTAQTLGPTGATGDYLSGVLVVPATTSPGAVSILDNATSITVFTGGASSVNNLVPFFIPLGMTSVSGAWKVTTGANVSVIGVGNFT